MTKIVLVLVAVLVVGGVVFLATWNMPPPTAKMEKVITNDRLK
jgi:hypothetical protein